MKLIQICTMRRYFYADIFNKLLNIQSLKKMGCVNSSNNIVKKYALFPEISGAKNAGLPCDPVIF